MIKYSQLENIISKLSFKCGEYNLETDEEIDLPYAAYVRYDGNPIYADGKNLFNMLFVRILLIDKEVTSPNENELKRWFEDNEIGYDYGYTFNEEERIHIKTFTFKVLDG